MDREQMDIDPSFDGDSPIGGGEKPVREELRGLEPDPKVEAKADAAAVDDIMNREFEYPAAGKTVKEKLEMILKRASQGYDYAQKMGEFNNLQKSSAEYQERLKQYEYLKEVDDYARANPEWTQFIKENWEKRDAHRQNIDPNDPMFNFFDSKFRQFGETFDKLNSKISELESEKVEARQKQEDAALEAEIQDIRKQYSNLPWDKVDEHGRNLEARVVEYAHQNGIRNFKTAFRDLYHDDIINYERDRAKEDLAKKRHQDRKQGFIGETSTSQAQMRTGSVRGKSYEDISRDIKKELGLN